MINLCQMVHSGMHKCTKRTSIPVDEKTISEDGNAKPKVPHRSSIIVVCSFFINNIFMKRFQYMYVVGRKEEQFY